MPFLSQDAEYLRCAHATLWMVLRHAHLAHGLPRHLTAEVHDATLGGVIVGRQVPSEGLSVQQMLSGATRLGLSPGLLQLPATREEDDEAGSLSLLGVLCRYVNSQLPPIVISLVHAWVVVAYRRDPGGGVTLWRHDDARGPYLEVADPWDEPEEVHAPWRTAITPLLPAVYVTAERAEAAGRLWFTGYLGHAEPDEPLARAAAADELTYRTYVIRSDDYVEGLAGRGVDPGLADLYRLGSMPEYVWVVEAVDRAARREGRPDVMGEALVDSTASTHHEPLQAGLLALHGGRVAHRVGPDHGTRREIPLAAPGHYPSGRVPRQATQSALSSAPATFVPIVVAADAAPTPVAPAPPRPRPPVGLRAERQRDPVRAVCSRSTSPRTRRPRARTTSRRPTPRLGRAPDLGRQLDLDLGHPEPVAPSPGRSRAATRSCRRARAPRRGPGPPPCRPPVTHGQDRSERDRQPRVTSLDRTRWYRIRIELCRMLHCPRS